MALAPREAAGLPWKLAPLMTLPRLEPIPGRSLPEIEFTRDP